MAQPDAELEVASLSILENLQVNDLALVVFVTKYQLHAGSDRGF